MKKFKKNLLSLVDSFETKEEMIEYFIKNKVFNEKFAKQIITCKDINNIDKKITLKQINDEVNYGISYKNNKISVDISKNNIFSYLDTEEDLKMKMKKYINLEEFEKAEILLNYLNTIDIIYEN